MHEIEKVVCSDCKKEFETVEAWESHRFKTGVVEEMKRLAGKEFVESRFFPVVKHYSENSGYVEEGDITESIHAFCKAESVDPERDNMIKIARACIRYTAGYTEDLVNSGTLDTVVTDSAEENQAIDTGSSESDTKQVDETEVGRKKEKDERESMKAKDRTVIENFKASERKINGNGSEESPDYGDMTEKGIVVQALTELAREKGSERLDWGEMQIPYDEIREKVEEGYEHELSESERGANVRIGNIVKELGIDKKRTREGSVVHDEELRSKIQKLRSEAKKNGQ